MLRSKVRGRCLRRGELNLGGGMSNYSRFCGILAINNNILINNQIIPQNRRNFAAETIAFQAETKKLLNIVTHSLYKDRQVFVREQISNASDALEKLRYLTASSQLGDPLDPKLPLEIWLSVDPTAKTLTIEDSGVGMTKEEVKAHLGIIAKSGTQAFLEQISDNPQNAENMIGQFGVGFYSSFVVADKVEVFTRSCDKAKDPMGWHWSSDGSGTYTLEECEGLSRGTKVVCHLKDDALNFANASSVKQIAQQYSSFVSFPLSMKEGEKKESINSQEALWLKSDATDEEHLNFYRYLSNASWGEPMYRLTYQADAPLSIKSVFYFPEEPPSRLFQSKTDVKVSLHSKRVLVKKSADEVIPKWLFFIEGIVDCADLPLNVSRENMQNSRLTSRLSSTLVRRILKFLLDESKKDPEKFNKFYKNYSYYLKEGLLDDIQKKGEYREPLLKLLRFECTEKPAKEEITLKQYIESMQANQKNIYYFCASDRQTALSSPYMESFGKSGKNVLLLYEDIDEFVAMNLQNVEEKKLVAIDSPDEDVESETDSNVETPKAEGALTVEQQKEIESFIKGVMGSKISAVKFSDRLTNSPAVVTGFLSSTLRKMMKATLRGNDGGNMAMANMPVTLELNPSHNIVTYLYHLKDVDQRVASLIVEQLHDNACIAAGIMDDPRGMLGRLNDLLQTTAQFAYHHEKGADDPRVKTAEINSAQKKEAEMKNAHKSADHTDSLKNEPNLGKAETTPDLKA